MTGMTATQINAMEVLLALRLILDEKTEGCIPVLFLTFLFVTTNANFAAFGPN